MQVSRVQGKDERREKKTWLQALKKHGLFNSEEKSGVFSFDRVTEQMHKNQMVEWQWRRSTYTIN